MKAISSIHLDPSPVRIVDVKNAFDDLIRESTCGHCRRTAQELCVIRRSMRSLRANCRWAPHDSMIADALTKRHGNSVTMKFLRSGQFSIVDEDKKVANRINGMETTICNSLRENDTTRSGSGSQIVRRAQSGSVSRISKQFKDTKQTLVRLEFNRRTR